MQIYGALGIEKLEIEKRQAWQNYIESVFNVQRRMGDWYFETAKSWEDLIAAHQKWVLDYNFQKHLAHEKREDGRHSPAEVLGWKSGCSQGECSLSPNLRGTEHSPATGFCKAVKRPKKCSS